ncbi:ParB/RepB/Spo0J family partition protein [Asticcacaulis excentricus]|uniref:ParB domain protein nuclease n=1 Tax=Asticcacaulis excentricus (strain ATCC 15261 / DSM 4724 / KCTC 12464 / NCIMB 9791 / VKM B-1370 / CB 48) TaxID=573065 RepID=E8RVW1_ASTEC|nr:ParB/RepB/Spo0J family partition protein [Asticcacaulis excentricus]ADU15383.1 ParB domain protein nuclease [Asticcacaulis excentricus CB 48]
MTSIVSKPYISVLFSQLILSELNLRAGEGPDAQIPELAATLAPGAAGQLVELFVKPAAQPDTYEILDGRRRYLAWTSLVEAGVITANHPVTVKVCETEDEIAQAVVIANAMRKEIQFADVLLTINRLISEHYGFEAIGRSLGIEAKEVRKMSVLGQLDVRILQAFKAQRFRLPLLRQMARIKEAEKMEALIEYIEESDGPIQDYNIRDLFDETLFATTVLMNAFPMATYLAKGGRIEQDLFEEQPDKILDPKIVGDLWKSAMKPVIKALKASGLTVEFGVNLPYGNPDGFRDLGWEFRRVSEADQARLAELKVEVATLTSELEQAGTRGDHAALIELSKAFAAKSLEAFNEEARPLIARACKATAGAHGHVKVTFYVDKAEYDAHMAADREDDEVPGSGYSHRPVVDATPLPKTNLRPDVTLYGHAHHLRTTTLAGRSMGRSLAETPMVALDVQLSAQFQQVVLGRSHDANKYVLKVCASARLSGLQGADNPLLDPVIERLEAYKAQYDDSGMHPFEWVSGLTPSEKLDLLAYITAAQVDMAESRTDFVRQEARAEAILISRTIGHDFKAHMQVEPDYYAAFSKKALLAILIKIGLDPEEYSHLKRGHLAETLHGLAHERGYVPPALNFHEEDYLEQASPEIGAFGDDDDRGQSELEGEEGNLPAVADGNETGISEADASEAIAA